MSISKVSFSYISTACNRTAHAADWGNNGLICYGACHAVAIYDPNVSFILHFSNCSIPDKLGFSA